MATYKPTPFDSTDVHRFYRETGPLLELGPRVALKEVGRYMDPDTGVAGVDLATLADSLETTESTVSRWLSVAVKAGLLEKHHNPAPNGHTFLSYTGARGLANGWQPFDRPSRGTGSLSVMRLEEMTAKDRRIEELEREIARLKGCDPATGEILNRGPFADEMQMARICKQEEEREEFAIPAFEKNEIPLPSSATPSSGEKNVGKNAYDLHTPPSEPLADEMQAGQVFDFTIVPKEFDEAFVLASLAEFREEHKWRSFSCAVDEYRDNWPKYRVELAEWRMVREQGKATATHPPAKRPAPMTVKCADCSTAMSQTQTGPSLTDANVQVCGPCWRKAFDAHCPDATIAATRTAEQARHERRAAVVAVGV